MLKRLVRTIAPDALAGLETGKRAHVSGNTGTNAPESLAVVAETILRTIARGDAVDERQALGFTHLRDTFVALSAPTR